jgi:F0F1-type ATP synthase membrane subunit b/b'
MTLLEKQAAIQAARDELTKAVQDATIELGEANKKYQKVMYEANMAFNQTVKEIISSDAALPVMDAKPDTEVPSEKA